MTGASFCSSVIPLQYQVTHSFGTYLVENLNILCNKHAWHILLSDLWSFWCSYTYLLKLRILQKAKSIYSIFLVDTASKMLLFAYNIHITFRKHLQFTSNKGRWSAYYAVCYSKSVVLNMNGQKWKNHIYMCVCACECVCTYILYEHMFKWNKLNINIAALTIKRNFILYMTTK